MYKDISKEVEERHLLYTDGESCFYKTGGVLGSHRDGWRVIYWNKELQTAISYVVKICKIPFKKRNKEFLRFEEGRIKQFKIRKVKYSVERTFVHF